MLLGTAPAASSPSVVDMLDRYAAGKFPAVVEELRTLQTLDPILEQLRKDGPGWIAADPADRERRELVAATFALEAARAGAWTEWKVTQKQPPMCLEEDVSECYQPLNVLWWKAPPLLLEWGCELLRRTETPRPVERWWQLAALSVAQRAEDAQFLVGDTSIGKGVDAGEIGNTQDEIKHLEHVRPRFPDEMRFVLAEGIARDRAWTDDALQAYRALAGDPDVGAEAMLRLGVMWMQFGQSNTASPNDGRSELPESLADAIEQFNAVESLTRDPYVIYLARYFKGRAFEQHGRQEQAEAAYRGAIATIPHAQSATISLAALLFRSNRRDEAQRLIAAMLAQDHRPADPWRTYVRADDRFWPQLIARLRAEILR